MTDAPSHDFTDGLYGWITHTDLASAEPAAIRGTHLFAYSYQGGGGIRAAAPEDELRRSVNDVAWRGGRNKSRCSAGQTALLET